LSSDKILNIKSLISKDIKQIYLICPRVEQMNKKKSKLDLVFAKTFEKSFFLCLSYTETRSSFFAKRKRKAYAKIGFFERKILVGKIL
jgi:hypothetical protein